MPRVVGIDHLVLSVGDFARSKAFYGKLLGFLGFKLKHDWRGHRGLEQRQDAVLDRAADAQGRNASTARATSASTTTRSSLRAARLWTSSARFSRSTG